VSDVYEFEITGTVGPLIASCLAEFDVVAESVWTVLTGTVDGPDGLRRMLDLLDAHGNPALDIRITPREDQPTASSSPTNSPAAN
jgi:hypothetical protein